jgi:hypothetical protein|tara:strand:- start:893 stop:2521 length:1629 start_codon:yes stop_codon:yes gene_type:complete
MPIVQISRIQHRRGKRTDLPQLAAGELGWVVDEQRLFIGNGTVSDGAPAVGNTEIVTNGSSAFTTALSHTYKGYLEQQTPIVTGASGDVTRTLQQRLDDYVSVKDFGAVGDDSTADVAAIQRAIDELYRDTDTTVSNDARARRVLFFPAGTYKINASLTIPPFAHLVGEGPDKTIIKNSASAPAMVTEDDEGQTYGNIGDSSATTPTQIQISNMTVRTTVAYGGLSIDNATKVFIDNVKFQGTFVSGGTDSSNSKGVTVRSTTVLPCANVVFNQCQFTGFARLVDMSFDVTNVRFTNCDFSTAYYGALLGAEMDGSTNGLTKGPRDVQFISSSWNTIGQQAIYVKPATGADAGTGPRNIISHSNFYAETVGNNFDGVQSISEVPIIQYDNDECTSAFDFFERTDQRDTNFGDSTDPSNTPPEVQGIGLHRKAVKQITLSDNTSSATDTGIYLPGFSDKGVRITYKMNRGAKYRTGVFTISSAGELCTFNDDFEETSDVGTTLSAITSDGDSTAGNDTIRVKYVTTSDSSTDVTMEYQIEILV